jgi:hypothetical protein
MSAFFQNLDKAREQSGQSWNQFIKTINVSYPTYLNWKRGGIPLWATVERVAKVLKRRPSELMEDN